jgi:TRAP-type C4-dicarboxylate transport system permease small subunit
VQSPRSRAERALDAIERFEGALLVALFAALVLVSVYQILARNLWGGGLGWGDAFARVAVLWLAVVGALVASRTDNHIRIDLLTRFLPPAGRVWVQRLTALVTAAVCATFAWYAALFVLIEYEDGLIAFGVVPAWACEVILPVGFVLIALKYLLLAVSPPR